MFVPLLKIIFSSVTHLRSPSAYRVLATLRVTTFNPESCEAGSLLSRSENPGPTAEVTHQDHWLGSDQREDQNPRVSDEKYGSLQNSAFHREDPCLPRVILSPPSCFPGWTRGGGAASGRPSQGGFPSSSVPLSLRTFNASCATLCAKT